LAARIIDWIADISWVTSIVGEEFGAKFEFRVLGFTASEKVFFMEDMVGLLEQREVVLAGIRKRDE